MTLSQALQMLVVVYTYKPQWYVVLSLPVLLQTML